MRKLVLLALMLLLIHWGGSCYVSCGDDDDDDEDGPPTSSQLNGAERETERSVSRRQENAGAFWLPHTANPAM